jgi:sugar phosphate isomerase/epimerase
MMDLSFGLHPKWIESSGGSLDGVLNPLQAAGLSALEFTLNPDEEWEEMRALAEQCVRLGHRCHFHSPYKDPFNSEGFASNRRDEIKQLYAPLFTLIERWANDGDLFPAVVIHGAHGKTSLTQLAEDTAHFLEWALAQTTRTQLMLENLPPKPGYIRVGESHEQVLEIVCGIHHPRLNVCWDLGHDVLQGYTQLPSEDFLKAVRHVHIHDINDAGEDHFPLVYGNVPWQKDLRALKRVNFNGAVTMEINGHRASRLDHLHQRLAESMAMMRKVVTDTV